jgi:hypothetical protein
MKARTNARKGKAPARKRLRYYEFDFLLGGRDALDASSPTADWERVGDALYEAGCDDALQSARCGQMFLGFTRRAPSLAQALTSALADVERAGLDLEVIAVRMDLPEPPYPPRKGAK